MSRQALLLLVALAALLLAAPGRAGEEFPLPGGALIVSPRGEARLLLQVPLPPEVAGDDLDFAWIAAPAVLLPGPVTVQMYAVTRPWDPGSARWDFPWAQAGGDYDDSTFVTTFTLPAGSTQGEVLLSCTPFLMALQRGDWPDYGLILLPLGTRTAGFPPEALPLLQPLSRWRLRIEHTPRD